MIFLAIVIAVLLLQAWGTADRVHHDTWYASWRSSVASWGLGGGLSLVLAVLAPALVVQLLLDIMQPFLFGLIWLLAAIVLLLYSFGRGDFQASMARYRGHAYSGDFEAAYLAAREEFPLEEAQDPPDSVLQVHDMVQRALLYEGFQRWFAVVFYFVLLGPAGAVAYRLSQLYYREQGEASAGRWLYLLDWVPARLLASTFALTGDFIGSRDQLLAALRDTSADADATLHRAGLAALGADASHLSVQDSTFGPEAAAQNREFDALLSRSGVCWIVALALVVLVF